MARPVPFIIGLATTLGVCGSAIAQDLQPEWVDAEAPILSHAVELTSRSDFAKAGEQYFSPDGSWIIFQGKPAREDGLEDPHYTMYIAKLLRDGEGAIVGLETPIQVSEPGSANTCGWFHPARKGEILFGTTGQPPAEESGPGYQGPTAKYSWRFPTEMEIVTRYLPQLHDDLSDAPARYIKRNVAQPLFSRPGYDAEGSWSPDGRYVLYAHVDDEKSEVLGRPDADIYVFDSETGDQIPLVATPGYDGGPFFSPDMSWICYRSDRQGDGNLQLFVAEVDYGPDGSITGIDREVQLTDNGHVNWAPYFHPSGRFLVYTTSELGHTNYEVYAIEFDPDKPMHELWKQRITHAEGFDGLPVFSRDGRRMIWCAQRGDLADGDVRPSSQIWIADFDTEALLRAVAPVGSF